MLSVVPPASSICETITGIRQIHKDCIIYTYYKDCARAVQEHFDKSISMFQNKSMTKGTLPESVFRTVAVFEVCSVEPAGLGARQAPSSLRSRPVSHSFHRALCPCPLQPLLTQARSV